MLCMSAQLMYRKNKVAHRGLHEITLLINYFCVWGLSYYFEKVDGIIHFAKD